MFISQDISSLKLNFLKSLLNNEDSLDANIKITVGAIHSMCDFWSLLFRNHLFDYYSQLLAQGIHPTSAEMNEASNTRDTNPWYWLATNSEGIAVFQALVERDILPTPQALSKDVWALLSQISSGISLFLKLIEKNILPSSQDLAAYANEDNVSTWYQLASNEKNGKVFEKLLEKNVIPTSEVLAKQNQRTNANIWLLLSTGGEERLLAFILLIRYNLLPKTDDLAVYSNWDNTNAWWRLASSGEAGSVAILNILFDRNILPSSKDLAVSSSKDNTNTWIWLAMSDAFIPFFRKLLDKNILPSSEDLARCDNKENTNTWFWLSQNDLRATLFSVLLDKKILPASQDLATLPCDSNLHTWHYLAVSDSRVRIFESLLDKNILPRSKDLTVCSSEININTWHSLAVSGIRAKVFEKLLNKNILPSSQDLSQRINLNDKNVWLLLNREKLITLMERLFQKDILPSQEDGTFDNINTKLINDRRTKIENLNLNYGIPLENKISILLTREDASTFYGFLYLFYLITAKKTKINLLVEVWFLIGKYMLPESVTAVNFNELTSSDNRLTFIKYHTISALDGYLKKISFFNPHKERASSLRAKIIDAADPSKILINQFYMSKHPKMIYTKPVEKYESSFQKIVTEESFKTILRDGCFLNKF